MAEFVAAELGLGIFIPLSISLFTSPRAFAALIVLWHQACGCSGSAPTPGADWYCSR
jgi:ABC-type nitrate/sulfonate/bicarbonate transport system permease component